MPPVKVPIEEKVAKWLSWTDLLRINVPTRHGVAKRVYAPHDNPSGNGPEAFEAVGKMHVVQSGLLKNKDKVGVFWSHLP